MRYSVAFTLMVLLAMSQQLAEAQECKRADGTGFPSAIVSPNGKVARPAGFDSGTISLRVDGKISAAVKDQDPGSAWTQTMFDTLETAAKGAKNELVWSQNGNSCVQTLALAIEEEEKEETSDTDETTDLDVTDCQAQGSEWLARVAPGGAGRRPNDVTMLVFREDGGLCYESNFRPRQGNPIFVGVFSDEARRWSSARVTFQPCSLEPTAPNVLVQGKLGDFKVLQATGPWKIYEFSPRPCWDPTVVVTVENKGGDVLSHSLAQATLYRATVHLGTVFSENHETTFGLRPAGDDTQRVFAEGPVDKGPEYVAAVVFYSLLRYIPPLGGRAAYPGRDPVRDNGFADKVGGVIGVGLRNPLKRFVTGFAIEIAAGVNVLTVWDWAETNVLTGGIREGDLFPSDDETLIPTQKEWRQKFVVGVSMDLVYATNAFRR